MEIFKAPVTTEGARSGNLRVTIPKAVVRRLRLPAPCWARVTINDGAPFFAFARRPPSRSSVDVGLPARLFDKQLAGMEITGTIESAEPYRARPLPWPAADGFDWLPHVPDLYFPTETLDGRLLLHNRYEEPFELRRTPPLHTTYRLLGWYQATGSRSEQATGFTLTANSSNILASYIEQLTIWGINKKRLALEILHPPDCHAFEDVGIEIIAERTRTGRRSVTSILHVRRSMPLLRLTRAALTKLDVKGVPNPP